MEKMASTFDNVQVAVLTEKYNFKFLTDDPLILDISHQGDCVMLQFHKGIPISRPCNNTKTTFFMLAEQRHNEM